ncbi:helix-turn-helix domain-containing protein [Streptococcus uberis]|uniref:helix-turn-helix domain-containing protein n=1 Tax=Streptococcus uberis TaxID=1349 RepID=UPI000E06B958|nr:helix-turn-helix transcriptional regulator [Streptococcus uberis]SUO88969.1 putative transcriptional regulator [Streptococcus uberis]
MNTDYTLINYIASSLKQIRKIKRYSQEKHSIDSGLDSRYINKLENSKTNARIDTLDSIIRTLDMTYSEFFEFELKGNNKYIDKITENLSKYSHEQQEEKLLAIIKLLED